MSKPVTPTVTSAPISVEIPNPESIKLKHDKLPVGDAIRRLVKLLIFIDGTQTTNIRILKEAELLQLALNAFEVKVEFDCMVDTDGDGLPDTIQVAQSALDVISCDAETGCCRLTVPTDTTAKPEKRRSRSRA